MCDSDTHTHIHTLHPPHTLRQPNNKGAAACLSLDRVRLHARRLPKAEIQISEMRIDPGTTRRTLLLVWPTMVRTAATELLFTPPPFLLVPWLVNMELPISRQHGHLTRGGATHLPASLAI